MIRLKLLGGLSAQAGDTSLDAEQHRKTLVLLAVVAASGGISRDRLLAYFWPESDTERARNALRQRLFALRRHLASDDLFIGTTELRLNPSVVTSDLAEFEAAVAAGETERAAELYEGPFLDGVHVKGAQELDRWLETHRSRLAARAADVLKAAAAKASARGAHGDAVRYCRRLVELDRASADATLGLLAALDDAGEKAKALQQAHVYETLMRAEYGAEPDPRVSTLACAIRTGDRPCAVTRPPLLDAPANDAVPPPQADRTLGASSGRRVTVVGGLLAAGVAALFAIRAAAGDGTPIEVGSTSRVTNSVGLELDPAISPDGQFLAYAAGPVGRSRIYVRQIAGGRTIALSEGIDGEHRWPSWSPDGTQIVFLAEPQIVVLPALGGAPRLLSDKALRFSTPAWSPDGEYVAFSLGDSVAISGLSDGSQRVIRTPAATHSLAWSPDGKRLVIVSQNPDFAFGGTMFANNGPSSVWTVSLADGTSERITQPEGTHASPVWTPDGRGLLFVSNLGGVRDVYHQAIDDRARPRGKALRLTTGLGAHGINLSRDGARLAYSALTNRSNIFAAPIGSHGPTPSSAVQPITDENQTIETVAASADGEWLAFDSDRAGVGNIYKVPASGGEPIQLTRDTAGSFVPQWSRDGRRIVFHSWRNGNRDVFVMNADGRDVVQVTSDPRHEYYADWAPDGRRLAFRRRAYGAGGPQRSASPSQFVGESGIMLTSEREDRLWSAASALVADASVGSPRWTHDGKYIVHLSSNRLVLRDVQSGAARTVANGDAVGAQIIAVAVGPDTSVVYFRTVDDAAAHAFYAVPVKGGPSRLLLRLEESGRRLRPEFATDSRRLYFTIAEAESDVWVMETRER